MTTTEATNTKWHENYLVCFDLETTGPDPTTARIVTADVVWLNPVDGTIAARTSYLADPGIDIPAEAAEIHGITTEYAREHGQPAAEVALLVLDDLETAWSKGLPVVAFNATYDFTAEDRELRRHHGRELKITGPVLDPLVIDRGADRYRRGSRKLSDMCAFYGVALTNAHNSAADAEAAGRLVVAQLRRHRAKLGRRDLRSLWGVQRAWHREWAAHYEDYLRYQAHCSYWDEHGHQSMCPMRTDAPRKRCSCGNAPEGSEAAAQAAAAFVDRTWPLRPYSETEAAA